MANRHRMDAGELFDRLRKGDRGALARLLTIAESEPSRFLSVADRVRDAQQEAWRIGITGSPGVGKSTLVDGLSRQLRSEGSTVAVLATDPSSERSGGALLGDRVRLSAPEPDPGLFFRSVGNRGIAGGLSGAVHDQLDLLDAFGFEWLLVEAVGAGQSEVEVSHAADLTVVVVAPESGDHVQAMKAGLMEVGDIFVISKCDIPGADRAEDTIRYALELRSEGHGNPPPVLQVSALQGVGLAELSQELASRASQGKQSDQWARRKRNRFEHRVQGIALRILEERLTVELRKEFHADCDWSGVSPHAMANGLLTRMLPAAPEGGNP